MRPNWRSLEVIDHPRPKRSERPGNRQHQMYRAGYRPAVHAREGRMLGIRQPLDGPEFEKLKDEENWCIHAMIIIMIEGWACPMRGSSGSGHGRLLTHPLRRKQIF
jgi:hypothetical protein